MSYEERRISPDAMLKRGGIDPAGLSDNQFESFIQQKYSVRLLSIEAYHQAHAQKDNQQRMSLMPINDGRPL